MKDSIPYEPGRVVVSRQGHDKGRWFVLVGHVDKKYVLIADGKSRRLEKPKMKQIKHLRAKPVLLTAVKSAIEQGKPLLDSDLRSALKAVIDEHDTNQGNQRPFGREEECALV